MHIRKLFLCPHIHTHMRRTCASRNLIVRRYQRPFYFNTHDCESIFVCIVSLDFFNEKLQISFHADSARITDEP